MAHVDWPFLASLLDSVEQLTHLIPDCGFHIVDTRLRKDVVQHLALVPVNGHVGLVEDASAGHALVPLRLGKVGILTVYLVHDVDGIEADLVGGKLQDGAILGVESGYCLGPLSRELDEEKPLVSDFGQQGAGNLTQW